MGVLQVILAVFALLNVITRSVAHSEDGAVTLEVSDPGANIGTNIEVKCLHTIDQDLVRIIRLVDLNGNLLGFWDNALNRTSLTYRLWNRFSHATVEVVDDGLVFYMKKLPCNVLPGVVCEVIDVQQGSNKSAPVYFTPLYAKNPKPQIHCNGDCDDRTEDGERHISFRRGSQGELRCKITDATKQVNVAMDIPTINKLYIDKDNCLMDTEIIGNVPSDADGEITVTCSAKGLDVEHNVSVLVSYVDESVSDGAIVGICLAILIPLFGVFAYFFLW